MSQGFKGAIRITYPSGEIETLQPDGRAGIVVYTVPRPEGGVYVHIEGTPPQEPDAAVAFGAGLVSFLLAGNMLGDGMLAELEKRIRERDAEKVGNAVIQVIGAMLVSTSYLLGMFDGNVAELVRHAARAVGRMADVDSRDELGAIVDECIATMPDPGGRQFD